jgi:hypothetical protein
VVEVEAWSSRPPPSQASRPDQAQGQRALPPSEAGCAGRRDSNGYSNTIRRRQIITINERQRELSSARYLARDRTDKDEAGGSSPPRPTSTDTTKPPPLNWRGLLRWMGEIWEIVSKANSDGPHRPSPSAAWATPPAGASPVSARVERRLANQRGRDTQAPIVCRRNGILFAVVDTHDGWVRPTRSLHDNR